jgi:hypothetical protein
MKTNVKAFLIWKKRRDFFVKRSAELLAEYRKQNPL